MFLLAFFLCLLSLRRRVKGCSAQCAELLLRAVLHCGEHDIISAEEPSKCRSCARSLLFADGWQALAESVCVGSSFKKDAMEVGTDGVVPRWPTSVSEAIAADVKFVIPCPVYTITTSSRTQHWRACLADRAHRERDCMRGASAYTTYIYR
jgi:hypothetical protein